MDADFSNTGSLPGSALSDSRRTVSPEITAATKLLILQIPWTHSLTRFRGRGFERYVSPIATGLLSFIALRGFGRKQVQRMSALAVCAVLAGGCASFSPDLAGEAAFTQRTQMHSENGVTVTVAVPSAEEAAAIFGVRLEQKGIQPVWVRIENRDEIDYLFLPADMDANYFSPQEVAWMSRSGFSAQSKSDMQVYFDQRSMRLFVPAGETVEGYVHTNVDFGVKYLSVILYHPGHIKDFEFVVEVPGIEADYTQVDFDAAVPKNSVRDVDREELRRALESYPCCVLGPDGKTPGDPLNIVIVGPSNGNTFHPFVRRGWDPTETISGDTVSRTVQSSVFRGKYRTSPVSALFVDGRKQDIALQKARSTVDERNHLRLWLTALTYEGRHVWIGQISRDIGVRFSSKTITTHKIDGDVDETREFLLQDMLLSGSLSGIGYVGGVGAASPEEPRYNYTLDPYFTDGLRAVLFLGNNLVSPDDVEFVPWSWHGTADSSTEQ